MPLSCGRDVRGPSMFLDIKYKALVVTATDTDAGKTVVTALLARKAIANGLGTVGVIKPVGSGGIPCPDAEFLKRAIPLAESYGEICPQTFLAPESPPAAAVLEGREVDFSKAVSDCTRMFDSRDFTIVEGVGGVMCPLTRERTFLDLASELKVPALLVVPCKLGMINHALLSLFALRSRNVPVLGFVANFWDQANETHGRSIAEIERRSGSKCLFSLQRATLQELDSKLGTDPFVL
ncbi:MAG: dethiobiotin synthase [Planctomycetes bacterium]|nr:dethiobiotin synthase [Planctomycetota bacterium]